MGEQKPRLGRVVIFTPPQECVGPASLTSYAAIVSQVNPAHKAVSYLVDVDIPETVELATFGPNSLCFQHKVPYSPEAKPGHWSWPTRV